MSVPTTGRRPRIGLLISRLDRSFHRTAWLSIAETARQHDVDAICFDGGVLSPEDELARKSNALYDLVNSQTLDGILVWCSCLDWSVQPGAMQAFCDRFRPLPLVSIGRVLTGFPSIVVDNYQGMRDGVLHLVEAHGFRRIAYFRGPVGNFEEVLRYQAYLDVLAEYDVPILPELISPHTSWERADGIAMVQLLLDERGLLPGRDFHAVVTVGDDMAGGAIDELAARGVRVPEDVAVVGFNDDQEGRAITPALTTVRQPVAQAAACATETLLALIRDGQAPEQIVLPLAGVIRESCGCLSPTVAEAAAHVGSVIVDAPNAGAIEAVRTALWVDLERVGWDEKRDAQHSEFLAALTANLRRAVAAGEEVPTWHGVLSDLRRRALAQVRSAQHVTRAESLLQQGRVLVAETAVQAERCQRAQAEREAHQLSETSQSMATAADLRSVLAMMAQELPRAGVKSCYLSLYTDPAIPDGWARFVMAYDENGSIALPEGGIRFHAPDLIPPHLWPDRPVPPLLALPLHFREHSLGFVLVGLTGGAVAGSETLRRQMSSALEGALLREDLGRAWRQAEEANRLKSRFLAMVSHELRTPLSLIVGTTEMLQREGVAGAAAESNTRRRDLERIRASAQHLSRLIDDVLDLASSQVGELRLERAPLHLDALLQRVAVMGESLASAKGLVWASEIPPSLPMVWGDRTRLQQVILNFISNAVKFTEQGFVTLWAEKGKNRVMVAVSDTGMGIPYAEQEAIFDEFRQTKRSTQRGYGGMGLGLAISKRLIEMHGGQIGLISSGADGTGSTFYFTLPVLQDAHVLHSPSEPCAGAVLVLTEDTVSGHRLTEHLGRRGYDVEMLPIDGTSDWLAQVLAAPPGAIVLDAEPAAERGWELIQALKRNPTTSDIPVVFYRLTDEDNSGSLLTLDYLHKPVSEEALVQAIERQGAGSLNGKRTTVLVVEDDPGIQDLHARIIRSRIDGCRIIRADDGAEALAAMATTTPDLVLLDLMMPNVDGFMVLERMREDQRTRHVPVIVLTAQTLTQEDMARLQQGVAAVLRKGLFSYDEVLAQVEAALACSKHLGDEAQRVARLAMGYIHEHYAEPVPRELLAAQVGVSERHLTRCFRQETGITPLVYLNRHRVQQACRLLETGQLSVTEVAMACGFGDSTHFGKVFRAEVGVSPRAYQRGARPSS